jgi:inorganic pyrophosphatase
MFEAIAGYGLGGSCVALFSRVGGGIYTKAADVGADLVGKVVQDLDEDSIQNPGTIADNVGDNVGDIAGMGADLFGSLAESTCACLVISGSSADLIKNSGYYYPLLVSASGIIVCAFCSLISIHCFRASTSERVYVSLNMQLLLTTVLMTPTIYFCSHYFLPKEFIIKTSTDVHVTNMEAFWCCTLGLWSGYIIGYMTNYYTSGSYMPVKKLATQCVQSAATNIISGLALGYYSTFIPVLCIAISIFVAFTLADMYGIALAAVGMLSTLTIGLTIDGYGPIADNAGGIAEMCDLENARINTDILDAAGNTTAAIGKGFAIGSACLVALALFGAFATETGIFIVNILAPLEFAGLIFGAMLPYIFSAMTMGAVGDAANEMIIEIKR